MSDEVTVERHAYGDHPSQFFDLYSRTPAPAEPRGIVISIHGGYWRQKYGLDLNESMSTHLADKGFVVANIEYRRATDSGDRAWTEMSSDVLTAIDKVRETTQPNGPVILLGHSAGGHLALWAAAQPDVAADGVIGLAPLTDLFLADGLALSNHATKDLFGTTAAERPDLYQSASPLHLLPLGAKQLIVHGDKDDSVPVDMSIEYCQTAEFVDDDITFHHGRKLDHFQVIDPTHSVWRLIDDWIAKL